MVVYLAKHDRAQPGQGSNSYTNTRFCMCKRKSLLDQTSRFTSQSRSWEKPTSSVLHFIHSHTSFEWICVLIFYHMKKKQIVPGSKVYRQAVMYVDRQTANNWEEGSRTAVATGVTD